ncbi:sulfonate ABC transporter substrate-binding protein [Hyphomicrobium sp. MC1]|uniref:sulfonate ABC transporter substrate-binding protein n=1 Tax=Hyphomicrobium sp. (strain MC1) TaxID=717785 RepID=UPI000213EB6E|nr:sulfonate ABC transporter substrate-binding protein [Hyphomicrobium sp. MC1]CCB66617.1 alkanesulfonate transport protein, periplasmic-binding subunit, ABC superfamily [Hyphomicrobium sp. MC1]
MDRRRFLAVGLATALVAGPISHRLHAEPQHEVRIGYQKNGILVIARQQGILERRLAKLNATVKWVEFSSGPPLLEALGAGSIDLGQVGDAPPIFAQAAGANLVYVAGQAITNGQGILVKANSPIHTLADLKGKRITFTKGSSAHTVVLLALEKAGLTYGDIKPVYLSPPDAAAAFGNDSVDAWTVWDPFFAVGEVKYGGRILVKPSDLATTNSFYIANKAFAKDNAELLRAALDGLDETAKWADDHRSDVAKSLAAVTGLDLHTQTIAANRSTFAVGKISEDIIESQQRLADRFLKLGLIPRPIVVKDTVWNAPQS